MKISGLCQKYLDKNDHLVINLEIALVLAGFTCILLNAITFRYSGDHYLSFNWLWAAPALLVITFFSTSWFKMTPNTTYLLKSYSMYFLAFFAFLVMLDGVQYTPFPTVDHLLGAADRALRVKEPALMDWTYTHPLLLSGLQLAYHSMFIQWLFMPLLLLAGGVKNEFQRYLATALLAYLLGAGIYYFFPTVGPAGIFSDPHFNRIQLDTVLNFKQIHQYLMVTTFDGGMIAFPSFHVLWAVISIYTLRRASKILFIPILAVNAAAVAATLFLGWNYAVDILCGFLVGGFAIYLARQFTKQS